MSFNEFVTIQCILDQAIIYLEMHASSFISGPTNTFAYLLCWLGLLHWLFHLYSLWYMLKMHHLSVNIVSSDLTDSVLSLWYEFNVHQVLYYLIRLEPFTTLSIQLQGGKFDHADRMFSDIAATWRSVLEEMSDVKELVWAMFLLPPQRCCNLNILSLCILLEYLLVVMVSATFVLLIINCYHLKN